MRKILDRYISKNATYPLYIEVRQRRVDGTLAKPCAHHRLDDGTKHDEVKPRVIHSEVTHLLDFESSKNTK